MVIVIIVVRFLFSLVERVEAERRRRDTQTPAQYKRPSTGMPVGDRTGAFVGPTLARGRWDSSARGMGPGWDGTETGGAESGARYRRCEGKGESYGARLGSTLGEAREVIRWREMASVNALCARARLQNRLLRSRARRENDDPPAHPRDRPTPSIAARWSRSRRRSTARCTLTFSRFGCPECGGWACGCSSSRCQGRSTTTPPASWCSPGADGLVFVADSQAARVDSNLESLENLRDNLQEHGRTLADVPHICNTTSAI